MKTEDEIRLIFSKLYPPEAYVRGAVGPFDWFLSGFRKGEANSEMQSGSSEREHERF